MGRGEPYETKEVTKDEFYTSYFNLTAEELEQIAHQSNDMIKHCSIRSKFGEEQCEVLRTGRDRLFTATYGICYMFNYVGTEKTIKPITSSYGGPEFGLNLIIDMESEYQC